MDRPPVFSLEVLTDRALLNDILKGVLCTIFFHRFFSSFRPKTRDLLDLTLPSFDDQELDTLIEARVASLLRSIEASPSPSPTLARGQLAIQFYEKRPRKASWFTKAEEKVCWEQWLLNVTIVTPRTETDRAKARRQIEDQLQATILKIITIAGNEKNHVPPITTNDVNPFPYTIVISQKGDTWGTRMGIF
ncbi:DUF1649-domain-containing protein [Wilcoxina mikolae CBS 423.85]|nr:DUF1649-domain-containing protein [Wilcoxina mikolae CBS 423.85]